MNEPKFTPGPWTSSENGTIDAGKGSVGDVWPFDVGREEMKSNAHLIAAAPDLYAALEELILAGQSFDIERTCAAIGQAHTALDKAVKE